MRSNKLMWVVAVLAMFMIGVSAGTTANAVETKWIRGIEPGANGIWEWKDASNWNATVPEAGDTIQFLGSDALPYPGNDPVGIDTKDANLDLPGANFKRDYWPVRYLAFFNSAYLTPNTNPLASQTDFTPVGPATTLQEAAAASPALTIGTLNLCGEGWRPHFLIPVKANAIYVGMGQPTGSGTDGAYFWGPLSHLRARLSTSRLTTRETGIQPTCS